MDTKKQVEAALLLANQDRKWLAEATGYSYFSVRDCLAPEGKKLSKRMFSAFMEAISKEIGNPNPAASEPTLPDRITLFVDPEKRIVWEAAASADNGKTTSVWAVEKINEAAEAWASTQGIKLLPQYAADAADGENTPSQGHVQYPKKRGK